MEFFPARYGRPTLVITLLASAVLVGAGVALGLESHLEPTLRLPLAALLFLIFFLVYLYSPQGFSIATDGLRIHRPRGAILIPAPTIRWARRAEPRELCGLRLFGSGGLFGFFGIFYARRFGLYRAYVTHLDDLVVVEAKRVYLLSPEGSEEFLHHLRQWIPGVRTDSYD